MPNASSLEEELKYLSFPAEVKLIPSGGGVFEVLMNEELIFSKKALNRFPNKGEIILIIENKMK